MIVNYVYNYTIIQTYNYTNVAATLLYNLYFQNEIKYFCLTDTLYMMGESLNYTLETGAIT